MRIVKPRKLICLICSSDFMGTHSQAKYCSSACTNEGKRISWRKYGEKNRDIKNEYHRKLYRSNPTIVLEKTKAYVKTDKGKEVRKAADAKQKLLYPEKYAARQAVLMAKRKGLLLPEPCECGTEKTQAHHEDYTKPLVVIWLCKKCHDRITFYSKELAVNGAI